MEPPCSVAKLVAAEEQQQEEALDAYTSLGTTDYCMKQNIG